MKRALPWLAASALVLAAGALTLATPPDDALTAPFAIRGSVGETVTSRTMQVEVTGAGFADTIAVPDASWQADGNWLVIEVEASAPRSEEDASVRLVTLEIDGRLFQASERPAESLLQSRLHVGTAISGSLAFELPADVRTGDGVLRLSTSSPTPLLDDVVAITVHLDDLPTVDTIELERPDWATP